MTIESSAAEAPFGREHFAARQILASLLAQAVSDPRNAVVWPRLLAEGETIRLAWSILSEDFPGLQRGDLGLGELPPDQAEIEPLVDWLGTDPAVREEAYRAVNGMVMPKDCPPYETEFCHWNDPTYRASQMADIAGFYRAFGLQPDVAKPERVDHAALEIDFVGSLLNRLAFLSSEGAGDADDRLVVTREGLASFMRDHVAWWMPTFASCLERRVREIDASSLSLGGRRALENLVGVSRVLRAWVAVERVAAAVDPIRQIISPQVTRWEPESSDDETCGACSSCDDSGSDPSATTPRDVATADSGPRLLRP